jgi:hypothetical protein
MNPNTVLLAVAMAVSPMALLASVLLLTTERGTAKAGAYAAGWVLAVAACGALTIWADSHLDVKPGSSTSTASAVLDVVLGVVLLGLAVRRRVHGAGSAAEPGWMSRLDRMSPFVAVGFGLFMPPYVIAVAGANNIVRADGSSSGDHVVLAVVVFTIVASLGVIVPWAFAITSSRSDEVIARWRSWLMANWRQMLVWLLLVIGAYLVAKGVIELV